LVFAFFEIAQGHMNAEILGSTQPSKMAAMETHWETGKNVPLYLVAWPDEKNEGNAVQAVPVPSLLSFLASYTFDGEVKGLKDYPPQDRPPVLPVFLSFRAMVGLAFLFLGLGAWAWWARKRPLDHPLLLKILPWAIALPYLANELGWTIAELGRRWCRRGR
ncbi:MAG: cytochrome ubiquinol oxidase subunit I, partial [Thermoanaerobaculaceae bacterium]|nr:cytochrome ubiquinol oxidase subunit I [Thermoanaerobaculaceae bacterium]